MQSDLNALVTSAHNLGLELNVTKCHSMKNRVPVEFAFSLCGYSFISNGNNGQGYWNHYR